MNHPSNNTRTAFLIIWFGQLISSIGSGITAFALGIYIFQLTHSATSYSLILLAAFLPSIVLKPLGGTLSDRMNRRLLMIIGDLGSMVGLIFIILMMNFQINSLWVIYTGVIFSSVFVALQNPAYKSSVTDLVDQDFYSKASGLAQLAESSRYIISPVIAGFLLKIMNIKSILIVDAGTFLTAALAVFWIKSSRNSKVNDIIVSQNFISDFLDGFKYIFKNQQIFILLLIISLITFFIGVLQTLLGPMILSFSNAEVFGATLSIATLGMLVGSLFIGVFGKLKKLIPVLSTSLILNGVFFSLLGLSTNILIITLVGFLFFLVLPFANTSLDVLIRKNVSNAMQGRIWSIVSLISQLGLLLAFGTAGFLADHVFNPLFEPTGLFAHTAGMWIGVGKGRGIGFMFFVSGIFVSVIAVIISRLAILKKLDA